MNERRHSQKTFYFSDPSVMERFYAWCQARNVAPGRAVQVLVSAFMNDLEIQRDQVEVTLPVREVRFT